MVPGGAGDGGQALGPVRPAFAQGPQVSGVNGGRRPSQSDARSEPLRLEGRPRRLVGPPGTTRAGVAGAGGGGAPGRDGGMRHCLPHMLRTIS